MIVATTIRMAASPSILPVVDDADRGPMSMMTRSESGSPSDSANEATDTNAADSAMAPVNADNPRANYGSPVRVIGTVYGRAFSHVCIYRIACSRS